MQTLAGTLTRKIVDHVKDEKDGQAVLAGLAAAVVVQLCRFDVSVDWFAAVLHQLKTATDAETSRRKKEN